MEFNSEAMPYVSNYRDCNGSNIDCVLDINALVM
jgi:hypothetical protein